MDIAHLLAGVELRALESIDLEIVDVLQVLMQPLFKTLRSIQLTISEVETLYLELGYQ